MAALVRSLRIALLALLALQAAQRLADGVFRVIGWAMFNRTGINLAPGLVSPKSG